MTENEKGVTVEELESMPLDDIRGDFWNEENEFLRCLYENPEKETKEKILDNYFQRDSIVTEFLKVKYCGTLKEMGEFVDRIKRTDIKVFLYENILNSDEFCKKDNNLNSYKNFLDNIVNTMNLNEDSFQNVHLCEAIIRGHKGKTSMPRGYVRFEREILEKCLKENITKIFDLGIPIGNYSELEVGYLGGKTIKKLLVDLESREKPFTSEELVSISHSVRWYDPYIQERIKTRKILGDGYVEEQTSVLWDENGEEHDMSPIIDLIGKRASSIGDENERIMVEYANLLAAGATEYINYFDSKLGGFYEYFEDYQSSFTVESRIKLLEFILQGNDEHKLLAWEVTRNIVEDLEKRIKWTTEKLKKDIVISDYDADPLIKSIKNSEFIRSTLLSYYYEKSEAAFESLTRQLMWKSDDAEEFANNLVEKKEFPEDFYYPLLMNLSFRQLQEGDVNSFKKNIERANRIIKGKTKENGTLVYLYSLTRGMMFLTEFLSDESNPPKHNWHLPGIIENKGSKRNPNERRSLCLYISKRIEEQRKAFTEMFENKEILNQMDFIEASHFFMDTTQVLTTVISEETNRKVISYMEEYLEKQMNYFKENKEKFFKGIYDESYRTNEEVFRQLFADLAILVFSNEIKDILFIINKNGNAKLSSYGLPVFNRNRTQSIRDYKKEDGETDRIGKRYADFMWEMVKDNEWKREHFLFGGMSYNLKHESAYCLRGPNQKISQVYGNSDSRYHLNGIIFPYLRKKRKEYLEHKGLPDERHVDV